MNPLVATTLRRMAMWAAALAATLCGHALTARDVHLLPVAPAVWLGLLGLAALVGSRSGTFTAWGPVRTLTVLLAAQAGLHGLMHWAPWMFGFVEHGHTPLVTPAALGVHVFLALAMLLPLCAGQRLLERLIAAVRALIPARRPRTLPRPARRLALRLGAPRVAQARAPRTSRGPPFRRLRPVSRGAAMHAA